MIAKLISNLHMKNRDLIILAGTNCWVNKHPKYDNYVSIVPEGFDLHVITRAEYAHKYFEEFIELTYEVLQEAFFDKCVSLTGQEVEPDGYDEKGFPSVLMVI
jgi:hypothetical protein